MKRTFLLTILTSAGCGLLLSSCNNSEELVEAQKAEILKGIRVTLPDSPFANETRTAHSIVSGAMHTDWQLGDTLGIYPIGGDQVAFPISEGEGTSTANFNGGAWALRSSYQYAAYYPFAHKNYDVNDAVLTFDYTGQEQNGDGSLDHLGTYDFLAAGATETNEDGSVDLTLNHIGSFVRMQLTIPETNTLNYVRIASDNTPFIIKGTVDLSTKSPSIVSKQTSPYVELKLKDIAVEAGDVVTLYMMMAPVNHSGSILTFTVSGNGGVSYSQTLSAGKNMVAGKAYNYAVSLDMDEPQYVAVDLGLPSGLKWASFNVGATKPYEYGDYFAWGETKTKGTYTWGNYKYMEFIPGTPAILDSDGFVIDPGTNGDYEPQNIGENISGTQYDAARQNWGGSWRMPTQEEFEQLYNYCNWTWTQMQYAESTLVNGYKVTGTNGNWIFLPAAGYRNSSTSIYSRGSYGYYLSSTPDPNEPNLNCNLYFTPYDIEPCKYSIRCDGRSVRPVTE